MALGVGDDAAVVRVGGVEVAIAVDALVDDVHFTTELSSYADVGWKAMAANVSDLAAVGARATAAVVSLQRPADLPDPAVHDLYRGLAEAGARWGVAIVGGDVVSGPALAVSVTVIGELLGRAPLRRSDAQVGDRVVVIGPLGRAAAALALHRAGATDLLDAHPDLLAHHRRPDAQTEVAAVLVDVGAHACIDVSDGLGRDAGHVADASGVRIELAAGDLPIDPGVMAAAAHLGVDPLDLVVGGGDDLALVATLDGAAVAQLRERLPGRDVHDVGAVVSGAGVVLVGPDGERDVATAGWEHGRLEEPT